MTSSAVRSSAGSRSKGGEEAIDISWDLKVMGYLCVSLGRLGLGEQTQNKTLQNAALAWSIGSRHEVHIPTMIIIKIATLLICHGVSPVWWPIKLGVTHEILQTDVSDDTTGWWVSLGHLAGFVLTIGERHWRQTSLPSNHYYSVIAKLLSATGSENIQNIALVVK